MKAGQCFRIEQVLYREGKKGRKMSVGLWWVVLEVQDVELEWHATFSTSADHFSYHVILPICTRNMCAWDWTRICVKKKTTNEQWPCIRSCLW